MAQVQPWTNINDPQYLNFTRLTWHCLKKGIQVGSVIGLAIVAPVTLYKGRKQGFDLNKLVLKQTYSVLFGSIFGIGMMLGKYYGWERKDLCLQDRAYRIQMNQNQNRVDFLFSIAFSSFFLASFLLTRRFFFSVGVTTPAVVASMIYYQVSKPAQIPE